MKKAKVNKEIDANQTFTITRTYNNSDRNILDNDFSNIKQQIMNFLRNNDNSNATKISITIKVKN